MAGDDDYVAFNDDDDPGYELLFYARNGASILLVNGDYVLKYDKLYWHLKEEGQRPITQVAWTNPQILPTRFFNPLD